MKNEFPEFDAAVRFVAWSSCGIRKPLMLIAFLFLFFIALPVSLLRYLMGSGEKWY